MEITITNKKKMNSYLYSFKSQPTKQGNNENAAKQRLFQISQFQTPVPLQLHPSNINFWNQKQNNSVDQSIKPLKYFRRTVHFRPSVENKLLVNKIYQDYQNIEESIIPKLKNILKKLQSPEKQRKKIEKHSINQNVQVNKREDFCWQQKQIKRNDIVLLQNMFESKRSSFRPKNSSNQKKSSKPICSHHQDSPMRKVFSRQKGINVRQFADQIPLMKQARKRRTLKNILF